MELQVNRWGNSLAVRLPAQLVRELQVQDGSVIQAEMVSQGRLLLASDKTFDRAAFLGRLAKLQADWPVTEPVVEQMRRDARY